MTNLLSNISGKFSTTLVLGTFFPVVVFVLLFRLFVVPVLPDAGEASLLAPLKDLDRTWELSLMLLASIVLSGVLYNLNVPHIRLYEGYYWQDTWIGHKRKERYKKQLYVLEAKQASLAPLQGFVQHSTATTQPGNPLSHHELKRAVRALADDSLRDEKAEFPKVGSVLPTRLGNVIRSSENYPYWQYRMSAIPLWPRLVDVISEKYAAALDDAKAKFDFTLNMTTLLALFAISLLVAGLLYPIPPVGKSFWGGWVLPIVVSLGLVPLAYQQAVGRARAWGDLIRAAFDLYRLDLLKKLGYTQVPRDVYEERKLWSNISKRMLFGDPPKGKGELLPYTTSAASEGPASGKRLAEKPSRKGWMLPVMLSAGLVVLAYRKDLHPAK